MGESREKEGKSDDSKRNRNIPITNYACRKCFIVDGYAENEHKCRWCGTELYEIDVV